jgi:hypothetical protein
VSVPTPFVQQLRATRPPIVMPAGAAGDTVDFRVEASDLWETVRISAPSSAKVIDAKRAVAQQLFPNDHVGDFVLKLRGWEVLDENATLKDAGIGTASIVLIAYRRRRPVR